MAEPSATQRDVIEELADSFMTSFRAGQRPSINDYVERFPDLADQLRDLLTALVVLEQHAPHRIVDDFAHAVMRSGTAPREIGDFAILREIGRGGMGVVYEAVQQSLGRHVALKVLSVQGPMNPVHLERFRLEARAAGRLHHSHIVPVFGVGEHEGLHYYAMQFIPGQSLDQVIEALRKLRPPPTPQLTKGGQGGADKTENSARDEFTEQLSRGLLTDRFAAETPNAGNGVAGEAETPIEVVAPESDPAQTTNATTTSSSTSHGEFSSGSGGRPFYKSVARVGLQVAEALAYAHSEGILHRDIKPSNLLLDAKGNAWVTDFGLAKADENQGLTQSGDFVGTLRYMAPERLDGWSDRRSDIYGLGVTLYELLVLRPFFESGHRAQLIDNIRHARPQPPTKSDPAVPRDLETIVLKAVAKEPAARYHTAEEMADDLRRFLADQSILARRSSHREQLMRWCRRNPAVAALSGALLAVVLGVAIIAPMVALREAALRRDADRLLKDKVALLDKLGDSLKGHDDLHLGWVANMEGRTDDARMHFRKGADLFDRIAADDADPQGHYRGYLADTLHSLAGMIAERGELGESEQTLRESIQVFESLDRDFPKQTDRLRRMSGAMTWMALLRLARVDRAGYQEIREAMIRRFGASHDLTTNYHLAWACGLGSSEGTDLSVPTAHAHRALDANSNDPACLTVMGIMLFRGGNLEEAVPQLSEANAAYAVRNGSGTVIFSRLYLAMAHQQLGHTDEARYWLTEAEAAMKQYQGPRMVWNDRLTVELLHREAVKQIPAGDAAVRD